MIAVNMKYEKKNIQRRMHTSKTEATQKSSDKSPEKPFTKFLFLCGGAHAVGKKLDLNTVTVYSWGRYGPPMEHWPDLIKHFKLTAQYLYELRLALSGK